MFDCQEILPTVLQVLSDLVAVDRSGDLLLAEAAKVQCKCQKKDGSDDEEETKEVFKDLWRDL
jgi:hypothetical protein